MVIKITVKTLDSRNYQFEAQDDWIVSQFKEHIKEAVDVVPIDQRLIYCGRVLQNDKKLTDYDCNDKVIHLVRRPPPSVDNPSDSSTNHNNNINNGSANDHNIPGDFNDNIRFSDDGNVILSAMTLGPDGNFNQILRHVMSLQQAIYSRTLGETFSNPAGQPGLPAEIDRRLSNASRILRMTSNLITECLSRLPRTSPALSEEGARMAPPRPLVTTTSSHTDLQTRNEVQDNTLSNNSAQPPPSEASVDDSSIGNQSNTGAANLRMPRQSLTTDDLPGAQMSSNAGAGIGSSTARRSGSNAGSAPRGQESGPRQPTSSLEHYLDILNLANNLQNQFQIVTRRYSQLVNISRRGGLIVPPPSTNSPLLEEARVLSQYFPRIMAHYGALQSALSDFSFDMTRGVLQVANHRLINPIRIPATQRGTGQPSSGQAQSDAQTRQSDPSNVSQDIDQTIEGSVTITTTTVDATPLMSTTTTNPQTSANILVTSEPNQPGIQIPLTIPFSFDPRRLLDNLIGTNNQNQADPGQQHNSQQLQ